MSLPQVLKWFCSYKKKSFRWDVHMYTLPCDLECLNHSHGSKLRNTSYICFQELFFFFKRNHYKNRNMRTWIIVPIIENIFHVFDTRFFLQRLDKNDFYFQYTVCRLGMRSYESNVKESYESFRRTKFFIFNLLLIWNGFGRFGRCHKDVL